MADAGLGSAAAASLWSAEVGGFPGVAAEAGARAGECQDSGRCAEAAVEGRGSG